MSYVHYNIHIESKTRIIEQNNKCNCIQIFLEIHWDIQVYIYIFWRIAKKSNLIKIQVFHKTSLQKIINASAVVSKCILHDDLCNKTIEKLHGFTKEFF